MKSLLTVLLLGLFSLTTLGQDTLCIGVKESEPFVYKTSSGHWDGITIEVLTRYLEDSGHPYNIIEYQNATYNELIDSMVSMDEIDIIAGDITITGERMEKVDFSQPYYVTNTAIATKKKSDPSSISGLFSWKFMESMIVLLAFIFISGFIMWLIEKKENEHFDKGALGIFTGAYFVSATMTTVGYGDVAAKTKVGQIIAFILMWLSLGMVGYMYGNITTALTVAELHNGIENVADLNKMKVGTIDGTTSSDFLETNDVKYINFDTAEEGLDAINDGELDAFVYDKPILQFYIGKDKYSDIVLSEKEFMEQTYGFILNKNSELADGLNKTIMRTIRGDEWEGIMNKYSLDNE
jgi:ABC-type amino acid transport substrate-binding protein